MAGILMVLAHPDDESFVGGGALAYYAQRGVRTGLVCLTDGQAGRMGVGGQLGMAAPETLGPIRRREMENAARVLGIGELITPGWMDGALEKIPDEEGIAYITEQIRKFQPDILISFGLEGAPSGHPDHKATWRWSEGAFDRAADPNFKSTLPPHKVMKHYWITWPKEMDDFRGISGAEITTILDIGSEVNQLKRDAFDQHVTQHDHLETFNKFLDILVAREFLHLGKSRVEGSDEIETDLYRGIEVVEGFEEKVV